MVSSPACLYLLPLALPCPSLSYVIVQRNWRLSDEPIGADESEDHKDPEVRKNSKCKISYSFIHFLFQLNLLLPRYFLGTHQIWCLREYEK